MKGGTLWICGLSVKLIVMDEELWYQGSRQYGITNKWTHEITVSTAGVCEDKVIAAIYHEVNHWSFDTQRNGYPDDEEECCSCLETPWVTFTRDKRNRWFWKEVGIT